MGICFLRELLESLHLPAQIQHPRCGTADGKQEKQCADELADQAPGSGGVKRRSEGAALDLSTDLQRQRAEQTQTAGGKRGRKPGCGGNRPTVPSSSGWSAAERTASLPRPHRGSENRNGQRTNCGQTQQKQNGQRPGGGQKFRPEKTHCLSRRFRCKGSPPAAEIIVERFQLAGATQSR